MGVSSRPALHIKPSTPCPEEINTPTRMDNSVGADIEVAQVKFVPPLHEQRRSWGLEILRRERVTSVGLIDHEIAAGSRLIIILTGVGRRLW